MENDLSLSQTLGGLRIANPDNGAESPVSSSSPSSPTSTSTPTPTPTPAASREHPAAPTPTRSVTINVTGSLPPSPSSSLVSRNILSTTSSQSHPHRFSLLNLLRRGESFGDHTPISRTPDYYTHPPLSQQQHSALGSCESFRPQIKSVFPSPRTVVAKAYRQSMPSDPSNQPQAQFLAYHPNTQNGRRPYPAGGSSRPVSGVSSVQLPSNANPPRDRDSDRLRRESSRSSVAGYLIQNELRGTIPTQAGVPSKGSSHRERAYSQGYPSSSSSSSAGNAPIPPRRTSRVMGGGHTDTGAGPSNGLTPRYDMDGNLVPSSEDWKDKGAAVGIREEYDANGKMVLRQVKKGVRDFAFGQVLGEGSYSTVVLGTDRQTLKEYAVKILDKKHIIKEKKIKYVNIEKDTLNRLTEHPGIVRLYYTFQDSSSLYYVLDIASGGELLGVLKKIGSFDVECTRFYGAQMLDAIEHMHNRGVIHRDLKPENVLMDDQMHIKITDFGTAKLLPDPRKASPSSAGYDICTGDGESTRARSFVGTAEYVSPELLTEKSACKASDLWAFGCIIYQLLTGRPPFKAGNEYQTFQKIVSLEYEFPPGFPLAARDLIERLLILDPQRRLSIEHIKNHEFFDGMQWGRDLWRMKAPRLKPYISPPQEPNIIKLNGGSSGIRAHVSSSNGTSRPQPRVITELPPPSQLDIEWSPVLTRSNERILKLGNLIVISNPLPQSLYSRNSEHGDVHEKKKLSRFFGGSTTKKRQRLVMVTSSARIILAAAGGEEKKSKLEISLLASQCSWRTQIDTKGHEVWCVDTHSMHYSFDDPKNATAAFGDHSKSSAHEWIESIERAKDIALSQSMIVSYHSDTGFDIASAVSTPNSTLHGKSVYPEGFGVSDRSGRSHLTKSQASLGGGGGEEVEKIGLRSRFSKRQSKNGLSTPF